MRSTKARAQFDTFVVELKRWEAAVPERARRFHALRTDLEREIRGAIPFWGLWIGDEVVDRYKDRVGRLHSIADPLADLIRDSEHLESEVRRLNEAAATSDAELTAWLEKRCRGWLALLGRLGNACERDTDLSADRALYESTESAVRLHHEAVHQLREADRILATLAGNVRAAELTALLPRLRRRLFTEGSSPEWLDEIKGLIQPLRTVATRIQDPPRELNEVGMILSELRGWLSILGNDELTSRAIERLEERRFKVMNWEPGEAHELAGEAQLLRAQLLDRVQQNRDAMLQELEEGVSDLRQACGDQPHLDAGLAELAPRQSNRPQLYRDWLAHFGKLRYSFKAAAQSNIGVLETRLAETRQRIAEKLEALERRPLSDEARKDAVLYAQDLRALREASGVEEVLRQLRSVNALARRVAALERRVEEELEAIERKQHELAVKHAMLEAEQKRVKGVELELTSSGTRIAALCGGAAERSLEERRHEAAVLALELDALEAEFVDRCRARVHEHLGTVQRASDVLRRAGAALPHGELPSIGDVATPRDAATALLDARALQHILLRIARSVRAELEVRRARARAEIASIGSDDLAPAERQRAEQLLRDLSAPAMQRNTSLIDALAATVTLIENCTRFFDTLQQEQRRARERLAELHARFREFSEEQLYRFCPELAERVESLIYGIPEHPKQWRAVHQQLDRAAELFARVRSQAQRLAADEIDRAAEILRVRLRSADDAPFRDDARKLLAELDACGPETLAPALLRQRVVNAAQRRI